MLTFILCRPGKSLLDPASSRGFGANNWASFAPRPGLGHQPLPPPSSSHLGHGPGTTPWGSTPSAMNTWPNAPGSGLNPNLHNGGPFIGSPGLSMGNLGAAHGSLGTLGGHPSAFGSNPPFSSINGVNTNGPSTGASSSPP